MEVKLKRRYPAMVILGILLDGQAVLIDGEEWRYQDGIFGIRRERWADGIRQDDVILGVDMSLQAFIKWCEKLPEETITQAIFSSVISKKGLK